MPIDLPKDAGKARRGAFISYARGDGEQFSTKLRERLEAENIPLWQDRVGMEGGYDWWLQIQNALMQVEFMVMIMTPAALSSKIVRKEWRYARQQGVCVYPVKGVPDLDFGSLPRWMRSAHFYDIGSPSDHFAGPEWRKFLHDLDTRCQTVRVPFMVEDPPEGLVERPEEFNQLINLLLDQNREEPVGITAALRGAGGYGKTTLAIAICHNEDIQNAFDDGILWVTLGESLSPADLMGHVEDLIHTLSGERPGFAAIDAAKARLADLLSDRDILMVIDNVWNRAHVDPFLQGGPRCARLITTRKRSALPIDSRTVNVDAMRLDEAVRVLGAGLPAYEDALETLYSLARRLGRWPQLLGLANGVLRKRVADGAPLIEALDFVDHDLEENGLTTFDENDEGDRRRAVNLTLSLSLKHLTDEKRNRFLELAIFPENKDVPLSTVHKLWNKTNGYSRIKAEKLCDELFDLSLLQNLDLKTHTIRLHDVIRAYLIEQQRRALPSIHRQLLDAHRPPSPQTPDPYYTNPWAVLPPDEPYFWDHLAYHLVEAQSGKELVDTVKNWRYLAKKTLYKKSLSAERDLLRAEEIAPNDHGLRTLRRSFAKFGHMFNRCVTNDENEIKERMFARLQHLRELRPMLRDLEQSLKSPHLALTFDPPDLPHPALIRTMEGHSGSVRGCSMSTQGTLVVSASSDGLLKIWDASSGEMHRTLEGHLGPVNSCTFSHDNRRIISASDDRTLIIWEVRSGKILGTLRGHSGAVNGCAFSSDGKLIGSASSDHTVKVWDAISFELKHSLKGHSASVRSCTFSHDSRLIASASKDKTILIWDVGSCETLCRFEGHSDSVWRSAFRCDNQRVVSASDDGTLIVWDLDSSEILFTLEGHSASVRSCLFTPDNKLIISASNDRTLRIWDAELGTLLRVLTGHSAAANGCALSCDGKVAVSASVDRTLMVWNVHSDETQSVLEGHSDKVWSCEFSPDGKWLISASEDHALRVWDAETGKLLRTLEDHLGPVLSCCVDPTNRLIVSASSDRTLKVWDTQSGKMLRTFIGHSLDVNACAFSPDGEFIVSASNDHTLRVWDSRSGESQREIEGHTDFVRGCAFSPNGGLIVSASDDRTLKIWDSKSGELRRTLIGHFAPVRSCSFSQDGDLIISASDDKTLKLWDAHSGKLLNTLESHSGPVWACRFNLDSKLIVSTSSDHTLKIWSADSRDCLATFYADGEIFGCAIYNETIVAGGERGVYFLRLVQ